MIDGELVRKAVSGNAEALDRLLLDTHDGLVAFVTPRLPADLRAHIGPEDVVQQAFMDAVTGIQDFRPDGDGAFEAWLRAIAQNCLNDALRAKNTLKRGRNYRQLRPASPEESAGDVLSQIAAERRMPSQSAAAHEVAGLVCQAVERLKPSYRQAIQLYFLDERPLGEVAARMGLSKGAVNMLCLRALAALARDLGDSSQYFSRE